MKGYLFMEGSTLKNLLNQAGLDGELFGTVSAPLDSIILLGQLIELDITELSRVVDSAITELSSLDLDLNDLGKE
jgi:hypothetical protein